MTRFEGRCEHFADIDVTEMADWVAGIPLEDWPQQNRLEDGQIRPSMATNPIWQNFGEAAAPVVNELLPKVGMHAVAFQQMLSVIMPGHSIAPHRDSQAPYWLFRVHVPLVTNKGAFMTLDGEDFHLEVGKAYKINTEAEHAIRNEGFIPRIHFMFDVRKP